MFIALLCALLLAACHESIEKRAFREAQDYTERYCPTPVVNHSRTDSVGFDFAERSFVYYCTFVGPFDNAAVIDRSRKQIHDGLLEAISGNLGLKRYVEEGIAYIYIVRSESTPDLVLYRDTLRVR